MRSVTYQMGSTRHRCGVHQAREVWDVSRKAMHYDKAQQGVRVGAGPILQHHRGGFTLTYDRLSTPFLSTEIVKVK